MLYYKPHKRSPISILKIDTSNTGITRVDALIFLGLLLNTKINCKPPVEKTAGKISKAEL